MVKFTKKAADNVCLYTLPSVEEVSHTETMIQLMGQTAGLHAVLIEKLVLEL